MIQVLSKQSIMKLTEHQGWCGVASGWVYLLVLYDSQLSLYILRKKENKHNTFCALTSNIFTNEKFQLYQ